MMWQEDEEEEFFEVKTQLAAVGRERDHVLDELRGIKRKMSKNEVHNQELNSVKESLLNANKELKLKDEANESLKAKSKKLESKLAEKDAFLLKMRDELSSLKASASQKDRLLSDGKRRIEDLEAEVERTKESEAKLVESFAAQKNQLQDTSTLLEKSKLDIDSLLKKVQELEEENRRKDEASKEEIGRLKEELEVEKENTILVKEGDKPVSLETRALLVEIGIQKRELKLAIEAEETSKKALDELALALTEVVTESKRSKEKLTSIQGQLEATKVEAEKLKMMAKSTEHTSEKLLIETKKENERLKNTIYWLRLEVDESLMAWNQKEIEFVKYIKKAEEETTCVQEENDQLKQLMKEAEESSYGSKEETRKLRDILKQALNEANVAKEAAALAREENSYLNESVVEKDKALATLAQETERLRIYEAEANESIMELKRIIAAGSKKEAAKVEKEIKEQKKAAAKKEKEPVVDIIEKEQKDKKTSGSFSFDLNQLWPARGTTKINKDADEDPEKDDVLVDSIFDLVESPTKEQPPASAPSPAPTSTPTPTTTPRHHRRTASASTDEGNGLNLDNFDEAQPFDDMEIDRNSQGKKKALLKRFGDLLGRKNTHPHPPKELPLPSKDVPKDLPQLPKDTSRESPSHQGYATDGSLNV